MLQKYFLWFSAIGLTPIAFGYGLVPEASLNWLFGLNVESVNGRHIFRAIMGLYLALAGFWIVGAIKPQFTLAALYSAVVFMLGLAAGRIISLVVDGMPNLLLLFYLFLEIVFGMIGVWLINRKEDLLKS